MATDVSLEMPAKDRDAEHASSGPLAVIDAISHTILRGLSSLKLTVVLFLLGINIILVGTLAQVDKDMWQVIDEYFRSWVVPIDLQVYFPRTWFPQWQSIPGWYWFPGGAAIGATMVVNLLAAHLVRFKTQATARQLVLGTVTLVAGILLTTYVILSGHNLQGLQGQPPFSWHTLWTCVKVAMGLVSLGGIYAALVLRAKDPSRRIEIGLYGVGGVVLGLITGWSMLARDNAYLGDSGMRILWQLIQATTCGLVLLAGCVLIFRKRGGIVLIHAGIGLMMFGQFFVSKYDVEEQMRIQEGQTKTYAEDVRHLELAFVESSNPQQDSVVVVPRELLLASLNQEPTSLRPDGKRDVDGDGVIHHPDLPCDLKVVEYFKNADLRDVRSGEKNPATAGMGKRFVAQPVRPSAGADTEGRIDLAAAYVQLLKKDGSGELGTYLLSQLASLQDLNERVEIGDKKYEMSLRFRRSYKPYQITLVDARKDDYVGTSTPRNYSSDVHLVDASRDVDREIHIWMNNPLRYAGETFYQSGYSGPPDSAVETTTLSVVTNSGWMIPYVSCMIVVVGLGWHFIGTLLRFLRRPSAGATLQKWSLMDPTGIGLAGLALALTHKVMHSKPAAPSKAAPGKSRTDNSASSGQRFEPQLEEITVRSALFALAPLVVVTVFAVMLIKSMLPGGPAADGMDLRSFGRLPIIADGRVKPFDTLARNSLRVLSNRETYRDKNDKSQPAIRWLLDLISDPDRGEEHRVIRIDNLEVLDTLGLKRRASKLYSIAEIRGGVEAFEREVMRAQMDGKQKGNENLTAFQRKILELDRRVRTYTRLAAAFQPPPLPPLPSREEFETERARAEQKLNRFRDVYVSFVQSIDGIQPPLAVPAESSEKGAHQQSRDWQPYSKAWATALIDAKLLGSPPPPALRSLNTIFVAYSEGKPEEFNKAVRDYQGLLDRTRPEQLSVKNSFWNRTVEQYFGTSYGFEEFFNHVSPFFFCWFPYLFAAVLAALSWLVWRQPLVRTAWSLACFAFVVHTLALAARIYISGRPPVTNLYSSAVFIGWGAVLFCLVWERLMKNGLPTFIGTLLGFCSLVIAHLLAGDGDTFVVLQAVLDTQFWLATHVVLITLGYSTTFLAGGIGLTYVLRGLFTPSLTPSASKEMARMIYGTTCFALFFSFFGTVLGGLWADDSWGRFWGWDPKENGALIIVIWNALVLHARWDGMVKDRGMAVLSVAGNIVTSWSWFGVNELNVGLHSYGFTEGVLLALGLFWASQGLVILLGCVPKALWWSFARTAGGERLKEV